jgi:hypothetical protein
VDAAITSRSGATPILASATAPATNPQVITAPLHLLATRNVADNFGIRKVKVHSNFNKTT